MTIGKVKFSQLPPQAEADLNPDTIVAVVNLGTSKKATLTNVRNYLITDGLATRTYVDNAINSLVDGAPDLLNTLNELADALGNDQNFYQTITDMINNGLTALFPSKTTDDLTEGITNLYFTESRSRSVISVVDPSDSLTYDPVTGVITFNTSSGGLVTSVNGLRGDVMLYTEHVPESINLYFTQERARDSLSAGYGVLYDTFNGVFSLPQAVGPEDDVQFANTTVTGSLTLGGDLIGDVHITDETESTDKDTGALVVEGGVGIEKNLNVGGNLTVEGTLSASQIEIDGLSVVGEFSHNGLTPTEGTNIDQIKTFTVSIRLLTDWQDTGINSNNLTTGTYIVQLYANDIGAGGTNNNEYYSGVMSWYQGTTGSSEMTPTDEIPLHRAGGSSDGNLYLRTFRTSSGDPNNLKLQIFSNIEAASAANYVFKFRRVI